MTTPPATIRPYTVGDVDEKPAGGVRPRTMAATAAIMPTPAIAGSPRILIGRWLNRLRRSSPKVWPLVTTTSVSARVEARRHVEARVLLHGRGRGRRSCRHGSDGLGGLAKPDTGGPARHLDLEEPRGRVVCGGGVVCVVASPWQQARPAPGGEWIPVCPDLVQCVGSIAGVHAGDGDVGRVCRVHGVSVAVLSAGSSGVAAGAHVHRRLCAEHSGVDGVEPGTIANVSRGGLVQRLRDALSCQCPGRR